jgi:hypothetical protein
MLDEVAGFGAGDALDATAPRNCPCGVGIGTITGSTPSYQCLLTCHWRESIVLHDA